MKILFIYPNAGSQLGFNYGVSHMSAVLKQAGHQVDLIQLCEDLGPLPSKDEFIQSVKAAAPDIIGFSVVTTQWGYTAELAAWCREASDASLVCGGIHATVAGKEILETGLFDYVMAGECDDAFCDLASHLAAGKDVSDLPNLGLVVDGKAKLNPVRPMPDLGKLPFKDYDIFDFQKIIDAKRGWVGLMASRGCPYRCTYCFNHMMVKQYRHDLGCSFKELNYIRNFDIGTVIDEIKYLESNYRNITMYIFDDDLFTFNKDYVVEFCREYKKVTNMPFVVNGHVGLFDEDRAKALADANCKIVKFGVESGSERIRKNVMHRYMKNDEICDAISIVHKYGMHSSCFIMFGLPYETHEDAMDTIQLMSKSKPGRYRWTFFYPFPGTESHQMSIDGGYVDKSKMGSLMNFTDASCLDFGSEQNLFLAKVGKILPWFVNAYSDLEVAPVYRERIDEILSMNQEQWETVADSLLDEDKRLSQRFIDASQTHYAVKYNRFMGVISDYFLNED